MFLLRIPLLAPVWTIVILGWITAGGTFCSLENMVRGRLVAQHQSALWIALSGFSFIVASIYVINQIVDIESDRINHKLFFLPYGIIGIPTAWALAIFCAAAGLVIAIVWLNAVMVALFCISLLLGALYNLPPASLKNHAWGGTFANFAGHGVCAFLVGWCAARIGAPVNWPLISAALLASLSPGFANAAIYVTSTIADSQGDRSAGKMTFCVVYGARLTAIAATVACAAALLFSFTLPYHRWVMAWPALASLALFVFCTAAPRKENVYHAFKWPVFLLTAFVAFFVPPYGALILATFFGSRAYYRWRFNIDYPTFKAQ